MGSELKRIDYLLNRRAGIEEDFSVPSDVTYLHRTNQPSGREGGTDDGSCRITGVVTATFRRRRLMAAAVLRRSRTGRSAPSSSTITGTASSWPGEVDPLGETVWRLG